MHRPNQFVQREREAEEEEEENKELKSISAKEGMAQRKQAKWTDELSPSERWEEGERAEEEERVLVKDQMDKESWEGVKE